MQKLTLTVCALAILGCSFATADDGPIIWQTELNAKSASDLPATMTPEMWFYMHQLERYDDPKIARRRRAEQIAAERTARIESRRWYGYSNLRPATSAMPFTDEFSAHWAGNTSNKYRWVWTGSQWSQRQIRQ